MSLVRSLLDDGYHQISPTRSGVGHFQTEGLLGDRPVSVLIDTGAANTIVSLTRAEELGLTMTKMSL